MKLHIYKTTGELIKELADRLVEQVNAAIEKKQQCNLVLTGGNSPKPLHALLVSPAYKEKVDWSKVFFFLCDERYVPFNDKDNNGRMAKETLFDPLNIAASQVFYFNTMMSPEACAADYARQTRQHFGEQPLRFDVVLLGLGDNAHTASLFPHTKVLHETKNITSAVWVEALNSWRITMTAPLINETDALFFIVFGKSKASAVHSVLEAPRNIELYPAQLINAVDGTTEWFMDEATAAALTAIS